ncbi:SpoIVB peptidase precursor [uncultured Clostridium sp.]|nr:SpoIVB peptidase precursor [uncultured Clostridium sp.]SCJ11572.1 SpoIVB peptidase precursor [uncultured Clostridium sp.]
MKKFYLLSIITIFMFILVIARVNSSEKKEVKHLIPLGNIVGIRANTDGILVLENEEDYIDGIKSGDNIVSIEGKRVYSNKDVKKIINHCKKDFVDVLVDRDGEYIQEKVKLYKNGNEYKLGLWIRDKISGVGTMTFYNPEDNTFSAIGHAIKDIDTNELIKVKNGNIYNAKDIEIIKGDDGCVGQIKANFNVDKSIGNFNNNDDFGINGKLTTYDNGGKHKILEVSDKKDVRVGPASILFQNKDGIIEEYKVVVKKINNKDRKYGKDMIVEVVDDRLIDYTGGIIQGMSGSPIIQNNKIIGALTHVFLDNSKIGYGIFIDKMII